MNEYVQSIVIVGGGSAGWITAGILAAKHQERIKNGSLHITLCESDNIPIIGVGEGSWPTLRNTLRTIGISETDFVIKCNASFKQGSQFINWIRDDEPNSYYHPFDVPEGMLQGVLAESWLNEGNTGTFAHSFCVQPGLANEYRAPKAITTPEYSFYANYGYHFDAMELAKVIQQHCTSKLGVKHVLGDVSEVIKTEDGAIESIRLSSTQVISGQLFIDCTGLKSLLLGEALGVKNTKVDHILFADTAIATHAAYASEDAPIASCTKSTAQTAGWIWDIGLPTRRGIGYVYSSRYESDENAEKTLNDYVAKNANNLGTGKIKKIRFTPGYKERFWDKNCVAIGLSAGFVEPLEASALVMIELSATMIADQLPQTVDTIPVIAKRFNKTFEYRWQRIIEFLKLHYTLSERNTPFWKDNREAQSQPQSLSEQLAVWRNRVPTAHEFDHVGEIFQAASYQFVLYGSSFRTQLAHTPATNVHNFAKEQATKNQQTLTDLLRLAPSNRELINKIKQFGLSKV